MTPSDLPLTRPPAVAGRFYPADATELARTVDAMLERVERPAAGPAPKALIAPHAGYVYSGPIAATAYERLRPHADTIQKVVLLGPAHRVYLDGLALPRAQVFATPLGGVAIDSELVARVADLPQVQFSDAAHASEHSLEVHLPFLQRVLGRFSLLPLVVGDASPREVAEVLERVWGGPETLIVISSDLSHYHPYLEARALDHATTQWILDTRAPGLDPQLACGAKCIDGLIELARRHPLTRELLDLRNSGDTGGRSNRDGVVGYTSIAFYQ